MLSVDLVTTLSTSANIWINPSVTTQHTPSVQTDFPISGIVGILLELILLIILIITFRYLFPKIKQSCKKRDNEVERSSDRQSLVQPINQYRVTTRTNRRKSKKYTLATIEESDASLEQVNTNNDSRPNSVVINHQLVEIQC
jgi:hypothetical protein